MKNLKIVILIIGILAFVSGCYNIIFDGKTIIWFGFISGAFLIWLFFNIDKFIKEK
jgi:hypothetical protein